MLEVLDLELLAAVAEVDLVAGRARRRDRRNLVERELPLGEDVQHLAPDIARRSDDRDPITHLNLSEDLRTAAYRKRRALRRYGSIACAHKGGWMRRDTLLALGVVALCLRRWPQSRCWFRMPPVAASRR